MPIKGKKLIALILLMAELLCNQSSKCFTYLLPFLENNLIDSCDSFLFGYTLGKNGMQNLGLIAATMEKILVLKKSYDVTQRALNAIYCLILEQNWTIVVRCVRVGRGTAEGDIEVQEANGAAGSRKESV